MRTRLLERQRNSVGYRANGKDEALKCGRAETELAQRTQQFRSEE
jgi:hypothetical protein